MSTNELLLYFAARAIRVEFRPQAGPDPNKCGSIVWISSTFHLPWEEFVPESAVRESGGEALAAVLERARDHFERTKPHSNAGAK